MYSRFQTIGSIQSHVENACGEMAYEDYAEENFPKLFARARKRGCRDVAGSVADMLFSDPDMIKDLTGDAFYDWSAGKTPDEQKEGAETLGARFPQCPGLAKWLLEVVQ